MLLVTDADVLAITGVDVPYQATLLAATFVVHVMWVDVAIVLVAATPEMIGSTTATGCAGVVNEYWLDIDIFPCASGDATT